ncbi:VOC family protein [Streptomyces sp. NPDC003758]
MAPRRPRLGLEAPRPQYASRQFTGPWSARCTIRRRHTAGAHPTLDDYAQHHDIEAETARLIALGAEQVSQWQECRVLRVPGGHLVCVLPVESDPDSFREQANVWP